MIEQLKRYSTEYGEKKMLSVSSASFFSPIAQAQAQLGSPQKPFQAMDVLMVVAKTALAASAAYLALDPSGKYAQDNQYNKVSFQLSSVLTGFLINLYAINYLCSELKQTKKISPILMVSFFLGVLSALPIFCIQQVEEEQSSSFKAIFIAILVTAGTTPLQILGFLEFCEQIIPKFRRFYLEHFVCFGSNADYLHEMKIADIYLAKLENSFNQLVIENNFPGDYLVCDEHELTTLLLHSSDYPLLGTYASYPTKKMLEIVCGLVGVMLAECVNASYIKATYIVLTDNKLSALLAGLLTCGIVFPMITLSAEFGYNATRDMMDGILSFCMQVTKYIHGQSSSIQLNLPSAISPWASICTFGAVILIASRSYAASIQFNNDTFKQDLSDETLSILNQLTVVGSLLFNIYAINNISTDWLSQSLKHFGGENIKKKTEFYQFGQSILKDYKKMPQGLLCSGIETVLGLDIENDEVVSSSNLSFSPL